ncbi:MAG: dimethylarginine dimethylaminohydrolase [Alphaproteobacteria bacterium]|nr:dimethylarginine dimethylaminohydrolase [Alphaproteobacteria bacterium]
MPIRFTRALMREPPATVMEGLRAIDRGAPDPDRLRAEHAAYAAALHEAGLTVEILPPLDTHPDSLFLEDPALAFPEGAILLRPGAASRFGEAEALRPELESRFERVIALPGPGTVDGGDVLTPPSEGGVERVLIGLSERTDAAGAQALVQALAHLGKRGDIVRTPPGVLHFKSECAPLRPETVLATERLAASGVFDGLRVIRVPEGEEPAANTLAVNHLTLAPAGYPATAECLAAAGFTVREVAVREVEKLDAGLSCLSLRWDAAPRRGGPVEAA